MVNKKGFIKTLEAIIAVVLLIIFVFSIAAVGIRTSEEPPGNVVDAQNFIFKSILNSESLRSAVLSEPPDSNGEVDKLVLDTKPVGYVYKIQFCDINECLPPEGLPEDRTIYVSSVYVVDTANTGNQIAANKPKILKVFMWEK